MVPAGRHIAGRTLGPPVHRYFFRRSVRVTGLSSFFRISQLEQQRGQRGKPYLEFLRVSAMSAGLYVLPAGGTGPQRPHDEDEIYYAVRGQARMRLESEDQAV